MILASYNESQQVERLQEYQANNLLQWKKWKRSGLNLWNKESDEFEQEIQEPEYRRKYEKVKVRL